MDQADVDLAIFVAEDVTELAQGGLRDVGRYLSHPRFADLDHRFGHTLDAAFDHIDPHLVRREIGVVARPDIGQCIVDILDNVAQPLASSLEGMDTVAVDLRLEDGLARRLADQVDLDPEHVLQAQIDLREVDQVETTRVIELHRNIDVGCRSRLVARDRAE